MYEYTVYAKISNREFELKTFFDSDGEPEKKAKTLIENNKNKFRSMRIEKRLVGLL